MRNFLTRVEKKGSGNLHIITLEANELSWAKTDCLDCANCCKTMSPTYTAKDMTRISKFLGMSLKDFKTKWLYKDRIGDWLNKSQPCQFLDLKTNLCGIYDVRPADCSGFPHHGTKKSRTTDMYINKMWNFVLRLTDWSNLWKKVFQMAGGS